MTISWKKWQVVLLCTSTTLQAYTDFYPDKPPETTLSLQSDTYGWCDFVVPTTDTEKNQLINPDIDVEIPPYKEECHALSEKIAILDKAEPELPKEDNEKEFVQLEFDFDKE